MLESIERKIIEVPTIHVMRDLLWMVENIASRLRRVVNVNNPEINISAADMIMVILPTRKAICIHQN